jgi:hypothetical protein
MPSVPRLRSKEGISLLNPRHVNFMQRFAKQTGIAATDYG